MSGNSTSPKNVTIKTHKLPADNFFGLQEAAWYAQAAYSKPGSYDDNGLVLFENGCQVDETTRNCTIACADGPLIFANGSAVNVAAMYTLQNCLIYPNISALLFNNSLSDDARSIAVDGFGFLANDNTNSSTLPQAVDQCFHDFCLNTPNCGNEWNHTTATLWPLNSNSYLGYPSICTHQPAKVNPDIGGSGALVAYATQSIITFLAWPALVILNWRRFRKRRVKPKDSQHFSSLLSGLVEFQKTQCFFLMAVDAASLIATRTANDIAATNWQQLSINVNAMQLVSALGTLTATSVLFSLHGFGKMSWYVFGLTMVTVVLSVFTYFWTPKMEPTAIVPQNDLSYSKSCGISPAAYCLNYVRTGGNSWNALTGSDTALTAILAFCMAIVAGLFFNLWPKITIDAESTNPQTVYAWLRHRTEAKYLRWLKWLLTNRWIRCICKWLVQLVLFLCTLILFLNSWNFFTGLADAFGTWGFGQIIAVTVWIPVIIDWLYASTFGLEKAAEYRIAWPYRVIRADESELVVVRDHSRNTPADALLSSGLELTRLVPAKDRGSDGRSSRKSSYQGGSSVAPSSISPSIRQQEYSEVSQHDTPMPQQGGWSGA